jgi:hypothetical protein
MGRLSLEAEIQSKAEELGTLVNIRDAVMSAQFLLTDSLEACRFLLEHSTGVAGKKR